MELGTKLDQEKDPWHLVPMGAMRHVVRVLGHGLRKYSANNWQHVAEARDRYFSAAMRHLISWREGELLDGESRMPHLAHAACCILFLLWFDESPEAVKK